jgi:hypothetical protein
MSLLIMTKSVSCSECAHKMIEFEFESATAGARGGKFEGKIEANSKFEPFTHPPLAACSIMPPKPAGRPVADDAHKCAHGCKNLDEFLMNHPVGRTIRPRAATSACDT